MFNLKGTSSDLLKLVTDAAVLVDVHVSWVDYTVSAVTPDRTNTPISSATTTTIVASPASGAVRNVKLITAQNKSTTTPVNVTVQHFDGTNTVNIGPFALGPGAALTYAEGSPKFEIINPTLLIPSYFGNLYAAYGNGDPQAAWAMASLGGSLAATPTSITASLARISYFTVPKKIVVNKVRYLGVGAVTTIYGISIYDGVTLAQLSAYTTFTTAALTWGAIYSGLALTLNAGQLYFIAVSVNTTGATAGILSMSPTFTASTGQEPLPSGAPGNLAVGLGFMPGRLAQGAVTAGALPNPFPTVTAQAVWTGGMPLFFLDNSNA